MTVGTLKSQHKYSCKFPFPKRENFIAVLKTYFDEINKVFKVFGLLTHLRQEWVKR